MQLRSGKVLNQNPAKKAAVPSQPIIGFKKASGERLVVLEIPTTARHNINRSNVVDKQFAKHRCSFALVKEIIDLRTGKNVSEARSIQESNFKYYAGKMVHPRHGFDDDLNNVCGSGIHFFLDRERAEMYGRASLQNGTLKTWRDDGSVSGVSHFEGGKVKEDYVVFNFSDRIWFNTN